MKERLIQLFSELDVVEYGEVELSSGKISNYKIIADKLFTNPEATKIVTKLAIKKLLETARKNKCGCEIAGVYTGGFIFASHVGRELNEPVVNVNYKEHRIDGKIKFNCEYAILEDVTTTGESVKRVSEMLRENGAKTTFAISIVDREEGATKNLEKHGIILDPFLRKSELEIDNF